MPVVSGAAAFVAFSTLAFVFVHLPRNGSTSTEPSTTRPPVTLARLPQQQCGDLAAVRDAGVATSNTVMPLALSGPWAQARPRVDAVLARYELTLQLASNEVPPALAENLRAVAAAVHSGRAELATADDATQFHDRVFSHVVGGFLSLSHAAAVLGDACGANFQLDAGS
jgi:hypothetical protein